MADILRPKSFSGLCSAAPSMALATLAITFASHDASYVAIESISMMLGDAALATYVDRLA